MSFSMKVPKIEKNSDFKILGHVREKEKVSRNISGGQITEINRKTGEITYAVEFIEKKLRNEAIWKVHGSMYYVSRRGYIVK